MPSCFKTFFSTAIAVSSARSNLCELTNLRRVDIQEGGQYEKTDVLFEH